MDNGSQSMTRFPEDFHPLKEEANLAVLKAARDAETSIYLVGGYIRDALCQRFSEHNRAQDFDYCVCGRSAIEFARMVSHRLNGHFVLLDEGFDTARVVLESGVALDFARCVGDDIEADVLRRDFTINALFWDPDKPEAVGDLVGGLRDIDSLTIRAINEANFEEDPLRLLRAFRFATILGATIEPATLSMIARQASRLKMVAPERINHELFMVMGSPQAGTRVKQIGEAGLLEVIFPELTATRAVTANAFHHLALWDHSLETVCQLEDCIATLPEWVSVQAKETLSSGITRLAATKLAALLHDIGKPGTWVVTEQGRHTFYEHDRLGAELAEAVARRLKWSRPVERLIVKLIRWHLRPGALFHQGEPTKRAVHRFYRALGHDVPELMLVAFGDLGATRGDGLLGERRALLEANLLELLNGYPVFHQKEMEREHLMDGVDIMRILEIESGPVVGQLIEALQEAQSLHEISSWQEAEAFVRQRYRQILDDR